MLNVDKISRTSCRAQANVLQETCIKLVRANGNSRPIYSEAKEILKFERAAKNPLTALAQDSVKAFDRRFVSSSDDVAVRAEQT